MTASYRHNADLVDFILVHIGPLGDFYGLASPDMQWKENQPSNFQYIQASNEEVNAWVKEKTGLTFELNPRNGYKVNDLKAMYGHLFADVVQGSEWWGYVSDLQALRASSLPRDS